MSAEPSARQQSNVVAFPMPWAPGTLSLPAFFGCEPKTVNRTIRLMALWGPRPLPSWLSRIRTFEELPRVTRGPLPYLIPYHRSATPQDLATQALWIIQNLEGVWSMVPEGFGFAVETESLKYRLRYAELPIRASG